LINGITSNHRQLGFYSLHPVITPKPINKSIAITREIDYVFIASSAIWEYLSDGQIASILTSAVNPQVAAKSIQDALQACDYNGNSCVVVMRLLKPELSFRSSTLSHLGLSIPAVVPPMRVEKSNDREETTLQKIEQRLERISEVIAKMEDDTTHEDANVISGRQLYDRIAAQEKVSSWVTSPTSSMAAPPPDPASGKHSQLMEELKAKAILVDEFSTSATSSLTPTATESTATISALYSNLSAVNSDPEDHLIGWKNTAKKGLRRHRDNPEDNFKEEMAQEGLSAIYEVTVERDKEVQTIQDMELLTTVSTTDRTDGTTATAIDLHKTFEQKTPSLSVSCPFRATKTSHNSGVYSIQKATEERHLSGSYETVCRSFDYYSHTKVRPYDDVDSFPAPPTLPAFLDFCTTVKSTTPYFEYASPRRRKMSIIEESTETQTSSSEERVPSASPPPLPTSEIPAELHGGLFISAETSFDHSDAMV
ncbi:hypothetical protein ANCCAN_14690, partial [Ancylostoma caninum]